MEKPKNFEKADGVMIKGEIYVTWDSGGRYVFRYTDPGMDVPYVKITDNGRISLIQADRSNVGHLKGHTYYSHPTDKELATFAKLEKAKTTDNYLIFN